MPMRPTGGLKQDWDPIVLHKPKMKAQDLKDPKVVNQALRTSSNGEEIRRWIEQEGGDGGC